MSLLWMVTTRLSKTSQNPYLFLIMLMTKHLKTPQKYLYQLSLIFVISNYHLFKIAWYLNFPSESSFSPHYTITPAFLSEVESVYFFHALFVFCFAFTLLKISKYFNVKMKVCTIHNKFTTLLVVCYESKFVIM